MSRPRLRSTGISGELVEHLNVSWRISGPDGPAPSFKQRLAAPLRRVLTRLLGTQETFNALVVQYINAGQALDKQRSAMLDEALDRLDAAMDSTTRFQEALAARERRMDAGLEAISAELGEIRTSVGVLQRATHYSPGSPSQMWGPPSGGPSSATETMSHRYVGFEDQFRGSPDTVRRNLESYVPIFAGASDVLDIGCGRGEFLGLLRERGVTARGVDLNSAMVEVCLGTGLQAETSDALAFLRAQPDASLGGLFAAQVVEHLEPAYLTHLLDAAFAKLRPGSPIVLETINPACWFAFFESYIRDVTHVRPLHPDTLKFLMVATGFERVGIEFRAPYPEHEKLQHVYSLPGDAAETLNANVTKLNSLIFTHLDYAAIAHRP